MTTLFGCEPCFLWHRALCSPKIAIDSRVKCVKNPYFLCRCGKVIRLFYTRAACNCIFLQLLPQFVIVHHDHCSPFCCAMGRYKFDPDASQTYERHRRSLSVASVQALHFTFPAPPEGFDFQQLHYISWYGFHFPTGWRVACITNTT